MVEVTVWLAQREDEARVTVPMEKTPSILE